MGITVLLGLSTTAILGNGKVEGVQFKGGGSIPADLVVVAAGIRPNVGLGHEAGLVLPPEREAKNLADQRFVTDLLLADDGR